jgi:PPM family protein phosphatase
MTASSALPASQIPPIEVWGATDVGRTREANEDSIFPDSTGQGNYVYNAQPAKLAKKGHLLIVADGVGGAQGGRAASQWAVQRAVERYYDLPGDDLGGDLYAAVSYANASLVEHLQHQHMQEAGCTLTAAVIQGSTMYVANVGDSRTYLIRDGRAYQVTKDHTLTQQKIDQQLIRPEDAALDPDKSVLTRSMGAVPNVQIDLFRQQVAAGDRVLLCSDGLHDMLSDVEIGRAVASESPKRSVTRLIADANKRGGFDNISVVVAQIGSNGDAAGWFGAMERAWRAMNRRQRGVLIALTLLLTTVTLVLCAAMGLSGLNRDGEDAAVSPGTPADVGVLADTPSSPEPPGATNAPVSVADPTDGQASPSESTSTADPTVTPEPTRADNPTHTATPRSVATESPPTAAPADPSSPPPAVALTEVPPPPAPPSPTPTDPPYSTPASPPPDHPACTGPQPPCEGRGQSLHCDAGEWVCR